MGVNWQNDAYRYASEVYETGIPIGTQQALQDQNSPLNQASDVADLIKLGTSIFLGITKNYIESRGEGTDPVADSELAKQIQGDIDAIFKKYPEQGINDLDSLEAYYENQKLGKIKLENKINDNNYKINNFKNTNNQLEIELGNLKASLSLLEKLKVEERPTDYDSQINDLKNQIKLKEDQLNENNNSIKTLEDDNRDLNTEITKIDLEAIEQDINNVKALMHQLKKANGEKAIEDLVNEDTDNFSKKIKDLIRAIKTGDKEKISQAAKDVETAYNAYKEKHANESIPRQIENGYEQAKKYLPKK